MPAAHRSPVSVVQETDDLLHVRLRELLPLVPHRRKGRKRRKRAEEEYGADAQGQVKVEVRALQ